MGHISFAKSLSFPDGPAALDKLVFIMGFLIQVRSMLTWDKTGAVYSVGTAGTNASGKQKWVFLPGDLNVWLSRKGWCKGGVKVNLSDQTEGCKVCEMSDSYLLLQFFFLPVWKYKSLLICVVGQCFSFHHIHLQCFFFTYWRCLKKVKNAA